jgi:predicted dehydrogenase
VRVGMIGFGGIAQAHRPAWNRPDVELHIIEPNPERRARAETAGIVHDDLGELLDAVEVVDICTPSDLHAELARTAARAGKQVICEKPIALTVDDGADVIRVARDAGVGLYIGHVVRFFGSYSAAHDAVVSGRIGTPSVLQFRRASGQPTANGWMQDESRSGGVPLDLMIHDIDQARWMAGDVVRVYAQGAKPGVGGVKTHVYAVLTHANGALTHITSSWGLAGGFETSFEIAGTKGLLTQDSVAHAALRADRPELLETAGLLPVTVGDSPFVDELREFAAAINGGPAPRVGPADALAALAIALAVRESMTTGAPVEIPALPADITEAPAGAEVAGPARGTW